jgi:SAM-dependent methyltransferase
MPTITISGVRFRRGPSQCQKPRGLVGRVVLWLMNRRHSSVTDWGLQHIAVHERDTILDVGCGGGRTVAKLAAAASAGKTYGIDYSSASVDAARRINREFITAGRVEIQQGSVLSLPFADSTFDLVTAVETHFWWADLANGMRECHRVLKPCGRMAVISEFYNGGKHAKYAGPMSRFTTMAVLNVEEHRAMFANAGFEEIVIDENSAKGWICVVGTRRLP